MTTTDTTRMLIAYNLAEAIRNLLNQAAVDDDDDDNIDQEVVQSARNALADYEADLQLQRDRIELDIAVSPHDLADSDGLPHPGDPALEYVGNLIGDLEETGFGSNEEVNGADLVFIMGTFYREGRRVLGLPVIDEVQPDPEADMPESLENPPYDTGALALLVPERPPVHDERLTTCGGEVYLLNAARRGDSSYFQLLRDTQLRFESLAQNPGTTGKLQLTDRRRDGWLEFTLLVTFEGGGKILIGCLQRFAQASSEFHS